MGAGSVDGLVSGLQTSTLIEQMMRLEARGQTMLRTKVNTQQSAVTAFQAINVKMSALLTAASALTPEAAWKAVTVTSSDPAAVTATATAGASIGGVTLDSVRLAKAETHTSATVAGAAAVTTGKVVVTKNGVETGRFTPADTSVTGLAAAINRADAGVRAMAIQVSPGQFQLQVTSTTTGAASDFSVSGVDPALGLAETTAGLDAEVAIGTARVRSATNAFVDVLPGVTFTAVKESATPVRLDLAADSTGVADKTKALVDAANAALEEIAKHTAYDAATKKGGLLMADSAVRTLTQKVLGAVNSVAGGDAAAAGIELTREGRLSFDRDVFVRAFEADPAALQDAVGATAEWSGADEGVRLVSSTARTAAGSYAVQVTQVATRAEAAVAALAPLDRFTVATGTGAAARSVDVTAEAGESAADFTARLNAGLRAAGIAVEARVDGGGFALRSGGHGSAAGFSLTQATGTTSHTGQDVRARVDGGAEITGTGQRLTVPDTYTPPSARGLSLQVTLLAGDPPTGTLAYAPGVAQRLEGVASGATDRADGDLTRAIEGRTRTIRDLNDRIASWDVRLDLRRAALTRQFSGLEVSLGRLRDQSSWLSGQIAGLPTYS